MQSSEKGDHMKLMTFCMMLQALFTRGHVCIAFVFASFCNISQPDSPFGYCRNHRLLVEQACLQSQTKQCQSPLDRWERCRSLWADLAVGSSDWQWESFFPGMYLGLRCCTGGPAEQSSPVELYHLLAAPFGLRSHPTSTISTA